MERRLTYQVWNGMRQRCNNENSGSYEWYGARGIRVCASWDMSFQAFLDDMGMRPGIGWSLERLEVNGNYEPTNCIWIPKDAQRFNVRPKPHPTGLSVVGPAYLLGYRATREPEFMTVITPAELPGRPEYVGETEWVMGRALTPPQPV